MYIQPQMWLSNAAPIAATFKSPGTGEGCREAEHSDFGRSIALMLTAVLNVSQTVHIIYKQVGNSKTSSGRKIISEDSLSGACCIRTEDRVTIWHIRQTYSESSAVFCSCF